MNKQVHHIQKQQLIMEFSSEEKSIEWNKNASAFYFNKLLPLLDNIFTDHCSEKQIFYLDKMELDLGIIEEKFLYQDFLKKIENELRLLLKRMPRHKEISTEPDVDKNQDGNDENNLLEHRLIIKDKKKHILFCFYYFLDYAVLPWNSNFESLQLLEAAIKKEIGYKYLIGNKNFQFRLRKEASIRRLYFQFSRGFWAKICRISYPAELSSLYNLRNELLKNILPFAKNIKSKKEIKRLPATDVLDWIGTTAPANSKDWTLQYLLWVAEKLSPYLKSVREMPIYDFFTQYLQNYKQTQEHQIFFEDILASYYNKIAPTGSNKSAHPQKDDEEDIISDPENNSESFTTPISPPEEIENSDSSLINKSKSEDFDIADNPSILDFRNSVGKKDEGIPEEDHETQSLEGTKEKRSSQTAPIEQKEINKNEVLKGKENIIISSGDEISKTKGKAEASNINGPESAFQATHDEAEALKENDSIKDQLSPIETDVLAEYYLRQAGVILVWPYLKSLYNHLEYLDGRVFKNIQYQQRAVHLLNYIATGQEQCEEHTLVIAKFICGWPLQMPVIKKIELTKKEKSESEQMIQQLIVNWPVLKKTSVEGVRSSFFVREGKLFKEEETWRLLVAPKSYDMLLDHLPYTISIIKLPWMNEILKVDWA